MAVWWIKCTQRYVFVIALVSIPAEQEATRPGFTTGVVSVFIGVTTFAAPFILFYLSVFIGEHTVTSSLMIRKSRLTERAVFCRLLCPRMHQWAWVECCWATSATSKLRGRCPGRWARRYTVMSASWWLVSRVSSDLHINSCFFFFFFYESSQRTMGFDSLRRVQSQASMLRR